MQRNHFSVLSLCLLIGLASVVLFTPPAVAQGRCDNFGGTIIASYDWQQFAWVGRVYMSFDGGLPVNGTILDVPDPESTHPIIFGTPSGTASGNEVLTFTVDGRGSFQMRGHYTANASSSPFLWNFHETGKIDPLGATDDFEGMTGHLSIQGLAILEASATDPWWWVAEITGSVCDAPQF